MSILSRLSLLVCIVSIAACGGGDGGSTTNGPTANAGADQAVVYGNKATLDGGGSTANSGNIVSYKWLQLTGTVVALDDSTIIKPSFDPPEKEETLTFELTITDDKGLTSRDTVNVVVTVEAYSTLIVPNFFNRSLSFFDNAKNISGNVTPSRTVTSSYLGSSNDIEFDKDNNLLIVASGPTGLSGSSILFFNDVQNISGNVLPIKRLNSLPTQLSNPFDILLDSVNNRLYVSGDHGISVYENADVLDGTVAPSRLISGTNTQIENQPRIFLDTDNDRLYVANPFPTGSVLIFENASLADGNVSPDRSIVSGVNSGLISPTGLWVDLSKDILYVLDSSSNSISAFHNASSVTGDIAPNRVINNTSSNLDSYFHLRLDEITDTLYVTAIRSEFVFIWNNASTLDGSIPPHRSIGGSNTGLNFPTSVVGIR